MRCRTEGTCNIFPSLLTFILPTYGPTPKLTHHTHHIACRWDRYTFPCALLFQQLYQFPYSMSRADYRIPSFRFCRCLLFCPVLPQMSTTKTGTLAFFFSFANFRILPVSLRNVNRKIPELAFFVLFELLAGFYHLPISPY
jgi:hypothetical protein